MRILIIGGTAFIGPYLCKELCSLGHELTLFNRGSTTPHLPLPNGIKHIYGDRNNIFAAQPALRALNPEVIIDMVAYKEKDMESLLTIFELQQNKPKIILISSGDVYKAFQIFRKKEKGPFLQPMPVSENADLRTILFPDRNLNEESETDSLAYNYDKILVEKRLLNSDYPYVILRLPMVYGPGDTSRVFDYLKRMDDKRPYILVGEKEANWRFSRGYVENVAHAIVLASTTSEKNKIYNVKDNDFSTKEWINVIAQQVGWNGKLIIVPDDKLPLHPNLNWAQDIYYDTSLIKKDLDYAPRVSLEKAIHSAVTWARNNPPAQMDLTRFDYNKEEEIFSKFPP